jgi:hypothetical protein
MKTENSGKSRMWKDAPAALCEFVGVDPARKWAQCERERDEATTKLQQISSELQMWRDGNILHENHREELDRLKRERDEAREYWGTETMNAADFFSQKTKAIAERDEAREEAHRFRSLYYAQIGFRNTDDWFKWENKK